MATPDFNILFAELATLDIVSTQNPTNTRAYASSSVHSPNPKTFERSLYLIKK